jgi:hypothetical protein
MVSAILSAKPPRTLLTCSVLPQTLITYLATRQLRMLQAINPQLLIVVGIYFRILSRNWKDCLISLGTSLAIQLLSHLEMAASKREAYLLRSLKPRVINHCSLNRHRKDNSDLHHESQCMAIPSFLLLSIMPAYQHPIPSQINHNL